MKKAIPFLALLFTGTVLLSSCMKKRPETKYVTLDEIISSGSTYSLEPGIYGDADDVASITTQAANYTVSQIDRDPATAKNIYHFSIGTKVQDKETVVITLKEDHGGRRGHCNQDVAVITINFTIK